MTDYLSRHQCAGALDEALLLTSDIVTNAFLFGGPPLGLLVECQHEYVEIRIHDARKAEPRRVVATDADDHGRGVALIDLVSSTWGVDQVEDDGKAVRFRLARHPFVVRSTARHHP